MSLRARNGTRDFVEAKSRVLRARSLPSSRPFNVAVFFWALHFLALITTLTVLMKLLMAPNPEILKVTLSCIGFCIVMWIIAFFKRRNAYCPLCKGTPLINSGALPHSQAKRFYPLNQGVTATLSIIATQRFCCMYCGSDFDLLKTPSHLRRTKDGDSTE
jgi:hypothetical protein